MSKPAVPLSDDPYECKALRPYGYATKAKLTKQLVRKMRKDVESSPVKPNYSALGREYGITYKSVKAILTYQSWRDI